MKSKLIAAGGLLFASAAFAAGMAVPAAATVSNPPCAFEAEYDGAWLRTDGDDVRIGTRNVEVCKRFWGLHHDHDDDSGDDD
ncbi:hypothetical protein ACQEUU_20150 [Nonomuraea sp. CA-218870]|uniref:hypothetical protein n=1 Tax=Nonomuraea sp. CA-218870 TaxID=3239998 RepID=UPI003D8CB479